MHPKIRRGGRKLTQEARGRSPEAPGHEQHASREPEANGTKKPLPNRGIQENIHSDKERLADPMVKSWRRVSKRNKANTQRHSLFDMTPE